MYNAPHYKTDGTKAGDRELPVWLFDGIVNDSVLHQAVRAYLLNQRQGSASAKTRSEVRGGSRKPWRQKGTGRARHGTIRSPIWEGGGVAFPPKPKSWRVDLPRKVKQLARRSAFNSRAAEGRVSLVDEIAFEAPKTKRLREILESMEVEGKVLLLTAGVKEEVYLSGRNLPHVKVMPFGEESAYDLLWASTVLIERPALESATEQAEAEGLDKKAEARIARAEARAGEEEAVPAAKATEKQAAAAARKAEKQAAAAAKKAEKQAAAAAKKAEKAAAKAEAAAKKAEEDEKAAAKEAKTTAETAAEAEAEVAEEGKAEKEAAGAAIDVSDIELPIVKELPGFLATVEDVDAIRALQERDERKTAQRHYDSRIEELTGEEGDDG